MNYLNIDEKKLLPTVKELNTLLADYHMYYQKLRNFHWNILGHNFFDLHEKFEELYGEARVKIDEIAERILTLRYHPISNYSEYLKTSSIKESDTNLSDVEMVNELLEAHSLLLKQMTTVVNKADEINDEGTIDLIGAYIRELEKNSWMLDAWNRKNSERLKEATA
ncbi:DNA starvation/stationary phase protection protein [Maribacter sp. MJ134]|jgi:starvation-inducible DNA-binding protein|uniref:Dps family protein n=1 Tax=Maribacter sp. MJ134 TaxID=2496865 RepID=UPI000F83BFFB|nr:DNA starvation/stationary phase protection protein [Maribacter sp. MJ134]AZQ58178.1 DNA starvation/stationary phase protection protein [Maribacter sp. MJ134]